MKNKDGQMEFPWMKEIKYIDKKAAEGKRERHQRKVAWLKKKFG